MREPMFGLIEGRIVLGSQELKTGSCRNGVEMRSGRTTAVKSYCAAARVMMSM